MRKPTLLLASACLLVANAAFADVSDDFGALLDEVWEWRLAQNPVHASRQGDRRFNTRWRDESVSAYVDRNLAQREFLRRLYALDKTALSETNQLNYELFRRDLQRRVDEFQFNGHLMPFNQRGGVQNLDSNTSYLRFETAEDYADWLERMSKIDTVIEQNMERIPDQIAVQLVEEGTESPFYRVFETMPDAIPAGEQERIREQAIEVIEDVVIPAYRELADYFEDVYLPDARESIGISSLPNGSTWYEFLARRFTTTRMTPDEIHRLGLEEVKRIRDEMQLIIDELEFDGDF